MTKFLSGLSVLMLGSLMAFPCESFANDDETEVNIGGAVRLNYGWKDYDNDSDGAFDFELFAVDVDITKGKWFVDSQFRFYQTFNAIHHAEVGYNFDDENRLAVGVSQVPFGISPYASHGFWFGGTYYLGFEDDYDTGIKWTKTSGDWTFDTAYFFNSEYDDSARYGRYSFDIASTDVSDNKEDGQANFRAQYQWGDHVVGASLQAGKFRNRTTNAQGNHAAAAVHFDGNFDSWNIQLQHIYYDYEDAPELQTDNNRIAMSAFDFPFEVATEANVTSFNVAKTFKVGNDFLDKVVCYNDFTYTATNNKPGLTDSIQNVTGCTLIKDGLYTYVDWIAGKNMWFAGGPGIGIYNGPEKWRSRLNINIGYYF
ncbi:outer membrane beta barrel protein [Kangiella japonica]|uniref:Outer membrane beta barrel protein n=1 Tax=Kangiella japonica TaxID=647384 RepID=A0ABN0T4F4_9GAMM